MCAGLPASLPEPTSGCVLGHCQAEVWAALRAPLAAAAAQARAGEAASAQEEGRAGRAAVEHRRKADQVQLAQMS